MTRFAFVALAIVFIPWAARGDGKFERVEVTGTLVLSSGEKLPAGAKVSVKIYVSKSGSGKITLYQAVGTHEFIHTDPAKEVAFAVPLPKSQLEKNQPGQFRMKATVAAQIGGRTKTIYATDDSDAAQPIDANGKPKTNVKLSVSKTKDR